MRQEPAWRAEARRLKSEGLTQVEIAKRVGVTEASVSQLLGVHSSPRPRVAGGVSQRGGSLTDATFFAPHTPHVARKLIDQAAIPAATRAFAADEINRAELMRRITPA